MITYLLDCNHLILNLGRGGKTLWIGDGFCDDANNIEECDYDGGDCCGINVQKNFCVNCTCTGRCKLTLFIGDFNLYFKFHVFFFINRQIGLLF